MLGVASPKTEQSPFTSEGTQVEVGQLLEDNGYTFPVVMDLTGEILSAYGISAFPTTFMIDSNNNVYGYVPGALTGDIMESIIQQTIDSVA